jgi:hypothetical protein
MKVQAKTSYKYEALDRTLFDTEKECHAYEDSLPRHLQYCLFHKIKMDLLASNKVSIYEAGYDLYSSHEEYSPPAFLNEGGYHTVTDTHRKSLGFYKGELSEVITHCTDNVNFWRYWKNAWVTEITIHEVNL